jgi:hypothetical protein
VVTPDPIFTGETIRASVTYSKIVKPLERATLRVIALTNAQRRVFVKPVGTATEPPSGMWPINIATKDAIGGISGPLLIYVEVCSKSDDSPSAELLVVSNTVATLVHVRPKLGDDPK